MKIKITLSLFALITVMITHGQKTVTTFHDWQKTRKMEVYQSDANGVKNGSYKYYDEDGFLVKEGKYRNGSLNGVLTEYTKFPNYAGKPQTKSTETYANDVLNGFAAYYAYDEKLGVYALEKGRYTNGERDSTWTFIKPLSKMASGQEYEQMNSDPVYKGSLALKSAKRYTNGRESDTLVTYSYHPSNKPYGVERYKDGKKVGEHRYFHPDGKLWRYRLYDQAGKCLEYVNYYRNGQVEYRELWNAEKKKYDSESYRDDGTLIKKG